MISLKCTTKQCPKKLVSNSGEIRMEPVDRDNKINSIVSEKGLNWPKTSVQWIVD